MAIYDYLGNLISGGGTSAGGAGLPFSPIIGGNFLIKHRGGNSAAAFQQAVTDGYVSTEGDVRFTSDSVPVMSHDASINGLSIASHTLAELTAAGSVYTFDDWARDSRNHNHWMEIDFTKTYTDAQCAILAQKIKDWGIAHRCTIEAYLNTSAARLVSYADNLILTILGASSTSVIDSYSTIAENCDGLLVTMPVANLTAALVNYAHSKGYLVRVWNENDSVSSTQSYFDMGADNIIVDTTKPSDL